MFNVSLYQERLDVFFLHTPRSESLRVSYTIKSTTSSVFDSSIASYDILDVVPSILRVDVPTVKIPVILASPVTTSSVLPPPTTTFDAIVVTPVITGIVDTPEEILSPPASILIPSALTSIPVLAVIIPKASILVTSSYVITPRTSTLSKVAAPPVTIPETLIPFNGVVLLIPVLVICVNLSSAIIGYRFKGIYESNHHLMVCLVNLNVVIPVIPVSGVALR